MKKSITKLFFASAFIMISFGAMAQGGLNPYVGSAHDYSVTAADATNNGLLWSVVEGTSGTDYKINSGSTAETVNITWITPGTYTLRFTETDLNSCSTTKEATINVTSAFEVSTTDPSTICNTATDTTNASANTTTVDFVVDMATGVSAWSPNWEVTFTIAAGNGSPSIGTVSSTDGSLSANGGGSYTLTSISSSSGTGTATISVVVAGDAFTELTAVLTITATTELEYNTTDSANGDWVATATIDPIPNTSDITTD